MTQPTPFNALRRLYWPRSFWLVRGALLLLWAAVFLRMIQTEVKAQTDPTHLWVVRDLARMGMEYPSAASFGFVFFSALAVAIICALRIDSEDGRLFAIPEHILRLPVPTWKIALAYMLPPLILASIASALAGPALVRLTFPEHQLWTFTCATLLCAAAVQAFALRIRNLRPWSIGPIVFAIFFVPVAVPDSIEVYYPLFKGMLPHFTLVGVPTLVILGILGLAHNRHCLGTPATPSLPRLPNIALRRRGPFPNARAAQRWYEWRRIRWRLPLVVALGALFIGWSYTDMVSITRSNSEIAELDPERASSRFRFAVLIALFIAPRLARAGRGRFNVDELVPANAYDYIRPCSHNFLWRARLHAFTKNVLLATAVFAVFAAYHLSNLSGGRVFQLVAAMNAGPLLDSLAFCLFLAGPVAILTAVYAWVQLSGTGCLTTFVGFAGLGLSMLAESRQWPINTAWILGVSFALIIASEAFIAFYIGKRGLRNRSVGWNQITQAIAACIVSFTICALLFVSFDCYVPIMIFVEGVYADKLPTTPILLLALAMAAVTSARLIDSPYATHKHRHQD